MKWFQILIEGLNNGSAHFLGSSDNNYKDASQKLERWIDNEKEPLWHIARPGINFGSGKWRYYFNLVVLQV